MLVDPIDYFKAEKTALKGLSAKWDYVKKLHFCQNGHFGKIAILRNCTTVFDSNLSK